MKSSAALKALFSPWLWGRFFLVIAMLYWVVARNGPQRIAQALLSVNPFWACAAAAVFFASIFGGAFQWYVLLRLQGIEYRLGACFRSYYSGMFLNNFLPGTVGGDALRVWDVHRSEQDLGKATAATLLDRLLGFSALSLFSLMALSYELNRRALPDALLKHLLWAVGTVTLCFALLLLVLLSRRVSVLIHACIRLVGLKRLNTAYAKLQDSLFAYKSSWGKMSGVFAIAASVQILRVAVHLFCAWSLGISISPSFFLTFIPLIALAAVLPLNVGGWGVPQSLGTYLYSLPGILAPISGPTQGLDTGSAATALAFLPSVIGMVVMLGGGFYFIVGRKNRPTGGSHLVA